VLDHGLSLGSGTAVSALSACGKLWAMSSSTTAAVMRLGASRVLTRDGFVDDAVVVIDRATGLIAGVEPASGPVPHRLIAPGFVDVQVNGVDDVDCARADGADWDRLDHLLLAQGVTAWCPTLVTMPLPRFAAPLDRIGTAMARPARQGQARPSIAGAHLEGPFLGGAPGAHPPAQIVPIDLDWLRALPCHVAMVTLAAEQPLAVAATELLVERGVLVSIGHSTAGHHDMERTFAAGALMATHLYNGMSGLHHREPGVAASVLTHPTACASLIADGVHVHPRMLLLAATLLGPDRTMLVTDAVAWRAGTAGSIGMALREGAPRLPDGTLAGSAVTMDAAVRTCVAAGVELEHALRAAATVPARVLGRHDRGVIEPGRRADLVLLSPELHVEATVVGGVLAEVH
jgi:N-acetylglucosamine-6-phosphate deacetylase